MAAHGPKDIENRLKRSLVTVKSKIQELQQVLNPLLDEREKLKNEHLKAVMNNTTREFNIDPSKNDVRIQEMQQKLSSLQKEQALGEEALKKIDLDRKGSTLSKEAFETLCQQTNVKWIDNKERYGDKYALDTKVTNQDAAKQITDLLNTIYGVGSASAVPRTEAGVSYFRILIKEASVSNRHKQAGHAVSFSDEFSKLQERINQQTPPKENRRPKS